ncbi:hypothetical protein HYE31_00945 [Mycoplasmopsis bovis]|nr:hypothetical protein HYE31_00945 [Mycoplasmopsis bovis]
MKIEKELYKKWTSKTKHSKWKNNKKTRQNSQKLKQKDKHKTPFNKKKSYKVEVINIQMKKAMKRRLNFRK